MERNLGWVGIVRLGLVQMALGAIVVLTTSTLNRVMVVELALPAMVPGALVTLHHAMQLLRPRMGYGSDLGQRHTPWIIGGMAVLAVGACAAAAGTALMATHFGAGVAVSVIAFALIGAGVSATGTSLLVLMAKKVSPVRRPAAATVVWMMMIAGFALTATAAGKWLEPYSHTRLIAVTVAVATLAMVVAVAAIARVEGPVSVPAAGPREPESRFLDALKEVWAEPDARRFTLFVLVSMLSYSAQDLILEPFAGSRFGFSPGESTRLSGTQHGGVFAGMLLVAVVTSVFKRQLASSLKVWVIGGCLASALAMSALAMSALGPVPWRLEQNVFLLGFSNGAFSIAAIGAMMAMAGEGRSRREGVRMGLWGAAQAIAFGVGGFLGTALADVARWSTGSSNGAYAVVFGLEVVGFVAAATLALRIAFDGAPKRAPAIAIENTGWRASGLEG